MRAIVTIAVFLTISFEVCSGLGFNCTFGMRWFDFVGTVYECDGSLLFDAENTDKVTSVNGTHQTGRIHSDVLALRMNHRNMEFFPVNIEAFFPNLKAITFYGNSIYEVKNAHLAPFPNLVYLNLYTNKITSIDGSLFDGLNSMQYVSFERNNIRHVGHDLVLPKAGQIYFDANPCINMRASTPDQIEALRFNLLINCTLIAPIEAALGSCRNLQSSVNDQVQSLVVRLDSLEQSQSQLNKEVGNAVIYVNDQVQSLTNQVKNLNGQVQILTNELRNAIGNFEQRFSQMGYAIENIMATVKDLLDRNAELEYRQKFGEERVQCLERITEGKCGL